MYVTYTITITMDQKKNEGKASSKTLVLVALAVLVVLAAVLLLSSSSPSAASGGKAVVLQLTDPPQVPAGTQSLVITYSSLQAHFIGGSGSGWLDSNSSGSVNLLAIQNLTQTIGTVTAPNASSIDAIRFNVTSASIDVNGTTYPVTLTSRQVTAHLGTSATANGTAGILISFSPAVVTILTANSTVFVLVPSVRAVAVSGATNATSTSLGYKHTLEAQDKAELEDASPNITITNVSLSAHGNMTNFSVTVKNDANSSVVIRHIGVFGNLSVDVNTSSVSMYANEYENGILNRLKNSTLCSNVLGSDIQNISTVQDLNVSIHDRPMVSLNATVNSSVNISGGSQHSNASTNAQGNEGNASENSSASGVSDRGAGNEAEHLDTAVGVEVNSSSCTSAGFSEMQHQVESRIANISDGMAAEAEHLKLFTFLIGANGTLALPSSTEDINNTGYALAAGQSFTFRFNGVATMGHGNFVLVPMLGRVYFVRVQGEQDAHATVNVTAG